MEQVFREFPWGYWHQGVTSAAFNRRQSFPSAGTVAANRILPDRITCSLFVRKMCSVNSKRSRGTNASGIVNEAIEMHRERFMDTPRVYQVDSAFRKWENRREDSIKIRGNLFEWINIFIRGCLSNNRVTDRNVFLISKVTSLHKC